MYLYVYVHVCAYGVCTYTGGDPQRPKREKYDLQSVADFLTPEARFFECLLSGKFKREEDLFIDRSMELFKHVLQFLRTGIAPPQDYIVAHKAELLEDFRIP